MGKFLISGGRPLYGSISVSGSKNAALPILFASLCTSGVSYLYNIPDIGDVRVAIEILSSLGANIEMRGRGVVTVDTGDVKPNRPPDSLVCRIRASSYLMGACLARFGRAYIQSFGGCDFSRRPIDLHLLAAEAFGATVSDGVIEAKRLTAADISFPIPSVGATVNALLMAANADGCSVLRGCAREPHITALIEYLNSAGAQIAQNGDEIRVRGGRLQGGRVFVPADMIEAGTFMLSSLVTGGSVRVSGVDPEELECICSPFTVSGAVATGLAVGAALNGQISKPIQIRTSPYPGFPTDLQPISAPVLATHRGGSITDTVWPERFGYLTELNRHGVKYTKIGNTARIFPSEIAPANSTATDLRGGMGCVIAALGAEGISVVHRAEIILRGYENLTEKLTRIGAEIEYSEK